MSIFGENGFLVKNGKHTKVGQWEIFRSKFWFFFLLILNRILTLLGYFGQIFFSTLTPTWIPPSYGGADRSPSFGLFFDKNWQKFSINLMVFWSLLYIFEKKKNPHTQRPPFMPIMVGLEGPLWVSSLRIDQLLTKKPIFSLYLVLLQGFMRFSKFQ